MIFRRPSRGAHAGVQPAQPVGIDPHQRADLGHAGRAQREPLAVERAVHSGIAVTASCRISRLPATESIRAWVGTTSLKLTRLLLTAIFAVASRRKVAAHLGFETGLRAAGPEIHHAVGDGAVGVDLHHLVLRLDRALLPQFRQRVVERDPPADKIARLQRLRRRKRVGPQPAPSRSQRAPSATQPHRSTSNRFCFHCVPLRPSMCNL